MVKQFPGECYCEVALFFRAKGPDKAACAASSSPRHAEKEANEVEKETRDMKKEKNNMKKEANGMKKGKTVLGKEAQFFPSPKRPFILERNAIPSRNCSPAKENSAGSCSPLARKKKGNIICPASHCPKH